MTGDPTRSTDPHPAGHTPAVNRRGFLGLSVAALTGLAAGTGDGLLPVSAHGPTVVPADKGLSRRQLDHLAQRGGPTRWQGASLAHIGMPVGGVTAGQLYLGGDGRLWWWDIDNPPHPPATGTDFAGVHYTHPLSYPDPDSYRPRFRQGFALRTGTGTGAARRTRSLDADGFDAEHISFTGQYPIGRVRYPDDDCPLQVTLEAFAPFVPLEVDDSSLPATLLCYTLRNTTGSPVEAVLAGWSQSPVCLDSRTQQPLRLHAGTVPGGVRFSAASGSVDSRPDIPFEDFEGSDYGDWTATGTAFGDGPVTEAELPGYMKRFGPLHVHGTRFVTSHNFRLPGNPDSHTGTLTSPPFTITRRYITARIGGGDQPGKACLNVLVDGAVVGSVTGTNVEPMTVRAMDVHRYEGRTATLQLVDTATGGWGHVNCDRIVFTDDPATARPMDELPDNGTVVLAALDHRAQPVPSLATAENLDDIFDADPGPTDVDASEHTLTGAVRVPLRLAPGESTTVRFAVCWYFPVVRRELFAGLEGAEHFRHHYATRFSSADDVLTHLSRHRDRLERATRDWVRTWYEDSTLPHWLLERTFATASTPATTTCYRFDNGRFYAFEGLYCCPGTCEHVWNYAQSVARIFPSLERDTRERVDLGIAFHPDTGAMDYRAEAGRRVATDGQAGTILRIYREHQMAPDAAFLTRVWPRVRKAVQYLIGQDGSPANGILEGAQYNTLDQTWWGEIPWISGLYVAALRAGEAMATEQGDTAFARRCADLAADGTRYLSERLWNDTYGYFIQQLDPDHRSTNSNQGCYVDQMYGQTYAAQLGLPRVFPADKAHTALTNLYRYNFLPDPLDYRDDSPIGESGRVFAGHDEPGLLLCTWPFGGGDQAPGGGNPGAVAYFNEVWTGLEYQAAAQMFAEGLVDEALSVTRAAHERYDADRRNPYNEIECSDHYTRAMMAFGVYLAAIGYEYHGPRGHLGFAPKLSPEDFRCAFTAAQGWGSYRQVREHHRQTGTVELRHGQLRLSSLAFRTPAPATAVQVRLGGHPVRSRLTVTGTRCLVTVHAPITMSDGDTLEVVLVHRPSASS